MMRRAMANGARSAWRKNDDRAGSGVTNTALRTVDVIEGLISGRLCECAREGVPVDGRERIAEGRKQGAAAIVKFRGPLRHRAAGAGGTDDSIGLVRSFP